MRAIFAKQGIVVEKSSAVRQGLEDVIDLSFIGVTSSEKLHNILVKVLEKFRIPETCSENKCK